jgi:hypothetical protein
VFFRNDNYRRCGSVCLKFWPSPSTLDEGIFASCARGLRITAVGLRIALRRPSPHVPYFPPL